MDEWLTPEERMIEALCRRVEKLEAALTWCISDEFDSRDLASVVQEALKEET